MRSWLLLVGALVLSVSCTTQQGDIIARALGDAFVEAARNKTQPEPHHPHPDQGNGSASNDDWSSQDTTPADNGFPPDNGFPADNGFPPDNGFPADNGFPPAPADSTPPPSGLGVWEGPQASKLAQLNTQRFDSPRSGFYYVDHCLYWGRDCGQPAADRFCQDQGYAQADDFATEMYGGRTDLGEVVEGTFVQGDGKACGDWYCTGFSHVTCS